jgi:flagella basal body P-ring formation protein FlgA
LNPAFKVPSEIKVSFAAQPISKQEIERKIENVLKARCNDCVYNLSIQGVPTPESKVWEMDLSQLTTKGGFLVPLRDGNNKQIKWISGNIRVSKLTPVTTRLISQGERLQAQDVTMSLVDVTFAKDSGLRAQDIQGQMAARILPVGTAVFAADLKREPAAQRGQIVKAVLGDDTFEITTNVEAQDQGFVGDLIKVKNMDNQKLMSALIVEKGVVKLQ